MPTRYAVLGASVGLALLLVAGLVAQQAPAPSGPVTPDARRAPRVITLQRYVRDFVAAIPRRESGGFDVPSATEVAVFADAVAAVRDGQLPRARRVLDGLDYDLVEAVDRGTGRRLLLLEERRNPDGSWPHGWGLYVLSPRRPGSLVVQVPHPLFDVNTPALGLAAFHRSGAGALFVAGTHRYANDDDGSSDVAHSEATMFQSATRGLSGPETTLLQFHGFAEARLPGSATVVVSDGAAPPSEASRAVADALSSAGFEACLYDGQACSGLGATTNVQGRWARTIGAEFLHVEVVRHLRDDAERRTELARRTVDAIDHSP